MARLVTATGGLALVAVLLTACGGSGGVDGARVEAGLRHYLSTLDPNACLDSRFCNQGVFPVGAGVPHVRENSCKKHSRPGGLTAWSCVVTFAHGKSALPVSVGVKRGGEVYMAIPMSQAAPLPPATTYEGGP